MSLSTNLISGLSSGFDWRTMVDQLIAVDHRRVDIITNKKTDSQNKLTEWQSFNTKLLALKTAAGNLKNADALQYVQSDYDDRQLHGQGFRTTEHHGVDIRVHRFVHIEGQQSGCGPEDLLRLLHQLCPMRSAPVMPAIC